MIRQLLLICLLMAVASPRCGNSGGDDLPFLTGIGPVWRHYESGTAADIEDMVRKLPVAGNMVIAQNNWRDSTALSGQVPDYFYQLLKNWPAVFSVDIGHSSLGINFFNQGTGTADLATAVNPANDWTNSDAKEKYRQAALSLCADYGAEYLALALEVNIYYWRGHTEDYARFVEFYKSLYDDIKALYPDTKVFVTFQLEHLKGLGDSSWGYVVDPHWDFFAAFDGKLDLVAFTTYPEFVYDDPGSIPEDYYSGIRYNLPPELRDTPLAFVEIGWSDRVSQQSQVDFLHRFLELTDGLRIEYVNWVFMHDEKQTPANPRLNLGLRSYEGDAKLIWDEWIKLER